MATKTIASTAVLVALVLLQGCSSAPRFEKNFGTAVRANLAAQTVDPRGAANTNPASGIDGPAARAAHERYQRSFVQPDNTDKSMLSTLGKGH
jgi:type IV pilus biogenesis protein CpaD/CtpE